MRPVLLAVAVLGLLAIGATAASVTDPEPARDPGGLSTAALSRCAGIAGLEVREADPAFGQVMLDGVPWLTAQRNNDAVVLAGSGALRRRNGTLAPFRFSCVLDRTGHAQLFRISAAEPDSPNRLPPARLVTGAAGLPDLKTNLPRGAELRLQLLDVGKSGADEILAEQLVRSGWEVPIPFALRLPADLKLEGRKLAITARVVLARQVLFQMAPRALAPGELQQPIGLRLEAADRP